MVSRDCCCQSLCPPISAVCKPYALFARFGVCCCSEGLRFSPQPPHSRPHRGPQAKQLEASETTAAAAAAAEVATAAALQAGGLVVSTDADWETPIGPPCHLEVELPEGVYPWCQLPALSHCISAPFSTFPGSRAAAEEEPQENSGAGLTISKTRQPDATAPTATAVVATADGLGVAEAAAVMGPLSMNPAAAAAAVAAAVALPSLELCSRSSKALFRGCPQLCLHSSSSSSSGAPQSISWGRRQTTRRNLRRLSARIRADGSHARNE